MAIKLEKTELDDAGFPIVSWWEDRDVLAIGKPVRVWCYITPELETGTLLFATTGSVRAGDTHNFRSWELLQGFGHKTARELYHQPRDRLILDALASKMPMTGKYLIDHAVVTTADFADEKQSVPLHLNCGVASDHDRALLHDELRRNFIQERGRFVAKNCRRRTPFIWPDGKTPFSPPKAAALPRHYEWLATALAVACVGLLALAIAWFVGVIHL